jgi:ketosteroid isomerase-like protein
VAQATAEQQQQQQETTATAKQVALNYYTNYNARNMPAVASLIADDCIYEDLVYAAPFQGKTSITGYLKKVEEWIPDDIIFVVEDITGDGSVDACGVTWHVEFKNGTTLPFSRGASFYRINNQGQIVYARDIVEPAFKPGSGALKAISLIAPVIRKLGPSADPAYLPYFLMWGFYIGYIGYVMLSTAAPGLPVWQTTPETLQSVFHESLNFFYVNIALNSAGLSPVPCIAEHPVSEALFNFVNAWSMMMLPVMVMDKKGEAVENKFQLWLGTMFLTNVFLPIYMAQRLKPIESQNNRASSSVVVIDDGEPDTVVALNKPWYSGAFGGVAGIVGAVSVCWALAARPEYGGLIERWQWFTDQLGSDRVFWAFAVDSCLYALWQSVLLEKAEAKYRFVPFFGMASWLIWGLGADTNDTSEDV